jgi:hypothetical protein
MNQNKKKIIRIDFIFSYWILFWFICHKIKLISFNPRDAIIFSICVNFMMFLFLIYNKSSRYYLFKFSFINTMLKIIPFITLYNTKTTPKDNYFLLLLLCLYLIWIYFNQFIGFQSINQTFDDMFVAYMKNGENDKETILSHYYDKSFNYLYKKINTNL